MNWILLVYMFVSFFGALYLTPWAIRFLKRIKLIVKDQNKEHKPLVPISGGLAVFGGLFLGIMTAIFFETFLYHNGILPGELSTLFAALTTIVLITLVGFVDDLIIKGDNDGSFGLKQWQKPLLTLVAAIPLVVINAGIKTMVLPIFGPVDLGLLYPLIFVPLGVVGAANMVNMLAGFNGLETGMGIVYTGMLGLFALVHGRNMAALIALVAFAALLAFYFFNKYPAKILPGDSLTYLLGGVIASVAIVGNIEKAALIASIPFFLEFILKARGKFDKRSYGYYYKGKVKSHYKKIYSLPHFLTRTGKFTEKQITYTFIFIELFFSSLMWVV
jgi:UDP-N-acetylglucosamine--dolichyl-phosphate N-acetylglucosaminephosphotransferase